MIYLLINFMEENFMNYFKQSDFPTNHRNWGKFLTPFLSGVLRSWIGHWRMFWRSRNKVKFIESRE